MGKGEKSYHPAGIQGRTRLFRSWKRSHQNGYRSRESDRRRKKGEIAVLWGDINNGKERKSTGDNERERESETMVRKWREREGEREQMLKRGGFQHMVSPPSGAEGCTFGRFKRKMNDIYNQTNSELLSSHDLREREKLFHYQKRERINQARQRKRERKAFKEKESKQEAAIKEQLDEDREERKALDVGLFGRVEGSRKRESTRKKNNLLVGKGRSTLEPASYVGEKLVVKLAKKKAKERVVGAAFTTAAAEPCEPFSFLFRRPISQFT